MADPAEAASLLLRLRRPDGGFAPSLDAESEPEPTALAALALADDGARDWLAANQRADGGFMVGPEQVGNDIPTALCALALEGMARERALDYLVEHRAQPLGDDPRFPHDSATRGWGWTSSTFGWVEPTARAVLVLKLLRPSAPEIADGIAVLSDRECAVGGWNYGNPEVLGRDLEPFLQTTAAGLMAVQDGPAEVRERAASTVEGLWHQEQGGLGWAMALVGLHLTARRVDALADALEVLIGQRALLHDGVALGWATLGLGDGWEQLRVAR